MGSYRGVVRHVRYWRGIPHRWSTVYQFQGALSKPLDAAACQLLLAADDKMCAKTNAAEGGTYECEFYNHASGGTAVASYTAFNWEDSATWLGYATGTSAWGLASGLLGQPAEASLGVAWVGGLSSSGKPVYFRKWYHAVPVISVAAGSQEVPAASVTSLTTAANALVGVVASYGITMGSSSGRFAGTASVSPMLENHQMPRGRRRKALVKANGTYTGPIIEIPD